MLAERYVVAPRQLQLRRSVRTAKLTSPWRAAAHARAASMRGCQFGGASAAAGAPSTSVNITTIAAVRRTARQASLSHVSEAEFLHTLTPAESDALEDMGEPASYPAGSVIFEQGGTPDCVLLVRAGRVRIAAHGEGGREVVLAK